MSFRHFLSRQLSTNRSKLNGHFFSSYTCVSGSVFASIPSSSSIHSYEVSGSLCTVRGAKYQKLNLSFGRYIHTVQFNDLSEPSSESVDDATMNEFLSRFVWSMRQKVTEAYPGCDKETIDGMLLIIAERVVSEIEKVGLEQMVGTAESSSSEDFSVDLWRTVWEVSNVVLQDMFKEKKKEKMKAYLQSDEVKEMYRFASEVGVRGDMLRELRFKWAREKMEESEFYQSLERLWKAEGQIGCQEERISEKEIIAEEDDITEGKKEAVSLPKRHGKIKYKIYGLDLSDPKWHEVADKIHRSDEIFRPQEPKQISGKCKLVSEKILSLKEDDDPAPLLSEWISLLQPSRIDWITLLDSLKKENFRLYLKIAEILLDEDSFQGSIHDYSKLVDVYAKESSFEDAERIINKMNENEILPDVLTATIMVHMYSKWGNLGRAKEAYEIFKTHGFHPDIGVYKSLIMAYTSVGDPASGNILLTEMEAMNTKPSKDMYMALLRSYAEIGKLEDARRISIAMQFSGYEPTLESCTILVEMYGKFGHLDQARNSFDHMIKLGLKPDDRCAASMLAAYETKNLLDNALKLLLQLEKDGFEPGVATYTVLVDWMSKLLLIDEAEQMLDRIVELGEAPSNKVHVSLLYMYSKAGDEKKAFQTLGVLESKKEQLKHEEFESIINSLLAGNFVHDARRMEKSMNARGFAASENLKMSYFTNDGFRRGKNVKFS